MKSKNAIINLFFSFLWIIPSACLNAQSNSIPAAPSVPRTLYQSLRYEEDWSYLKDTALKTKLLDKIKFIPLNAAMSNYLSVGGESRLRFEFYHNENLGTTPYADNSYIQQRTLLHADLYLSRFFRLFTQLNSSTTSFRKGGPRPVFDKDVIDINQAFFDIAFGGRNNNFTVRTGRQELFYGNGKLVEPREGPNQRLAFNALRFIAKTKSVKIETFIAQPVINKQNAFDNTRDTTTLFWGLYASFLLPKHISLDAYYFGIRKTHALFEKGSGKELRHTFGFRLNGKFKKLGYETENFLQAGTFSKYAIVARGASINFSYEMPSQLLRSTVAIGGAINSGDKGAASGKLGTFNALFPTGFYFGPPAFPIGPANLKALRLSLNSVLTKNLLFLPSWNVFWRQSTEDGVYTPGSTLFSEGKSIAKTYTGNQINIIVVWKANTHTTISSSYALFTPGGFFKEKALTKKVTYINTDLTFKF